jgi:hypothetical protein
MADPCTAEYEAGFEKEENMSGLRQPVFFQSIGIGVITGPFGIFLSRHYARRITNPIAYPIRENFVDSCFAIGFYAARQKRALKHATIGSVIGIVIACSMLILPGVWFYRV